MAPDKKDDFMKICKMQKTLAGALAIGLAALALNASGQSGPAATPLPFAASEIVKLAQAKINDDTIIAYVKSTRANYSLSADQILYLRQQGASEAVITAMLGQATAAAPPVAPPAAPAPAAPPPLQATTAAPTTSTAVVAAPSVTYVQTAPPYYYYGTPYYYPYYGYYGWPFPGVAFTFGWGGHWGGGWHGGRR